MPTTTEPDVGSDSGAPAPSAPERRSALLVAAAASAAAGLIHAGAAASHREARSLAVAFALAVVVQVAWAVAAIMRPRPVVAAVGLAVNGGMVLSWAAAATVGWPVIEAMAEPISVGVQDLMALALAVVAAAGAFVALVGVPLPRPLTATPVAAIASVILLVAAVPALAVEHSHDHDPGSDHSHAPGEAHDHDEAVVHSHGDDDDAGEGHDHGTAGSAYDHDDPIISFDDPRLTDQQRAAAKALYDDVQREMARFSDPASVEAEGYLSIGDGITGYEHFSHPVLRMDPITLDPSRPESIVFRVNPDGSKELVSAMFIMPPGTTMDDVPDIAGTLTTWHDHQDLCWIGDRVVGTTPTPGECAFGEFRVGQAMMHVWLVPHPCGPFAGLEGHGGDCSQHAH